MCVVLLLSFLKCEKNFVSAFLLVFNVLKILIRIFTSIKQLKPKLS